MKAFTSICFFFVGVLLALFALSALCGIWSQAVWLWHAAQPWLPLVPQVLTCAWLIGMGAAFASLPFLDQSKSSNSEEKK